MKKLLIIPALLLFGSCQALERMEVELQGMQITLDDQGVKLEAAINDKRSTADELEDLQDGVSKMKEDAKALQGSVEAVQEEAMSVTEAVLIAGVSALFGGGAVPAAGAVNARRRRRKQVEAVETD